MGDSDDDYNNQSSNNALNTSSGNNNNNSYNNGNMNRNKNRDKFYRERDDSNSYNNNNSNYNNTNSNNNNSNYNNGGNKRDWNNDRNRGGSNDWKGRSQSSGGYNSGGGYGQRMQQQSNDYPRKYSSHHNNNNNSPSPPPHKRNKKEWDMDQVYGHHSSRHSGGGDFHHKSHHQQQQQQQMDPEYPTQPPLLSFKQYLQQQDDSISDEEAIKRYNEYKIEFKKTQINNFFLEHKEEEWFKSRYHPDENYKRRREQNQFVLNRLEAFMDLKNSGWLNDENLSCDYENQKELVKLLDAFVIKLEGGNDEDIKKILDNTNSGNAGAASTDKNEDQNSDETKNDEENSEKNGTEDGKSNKRKKSAEDSGSESGAYTDDSDDEEKQRKKSRHKTSDESRQNSNKSQQLHNLHKTSSIFMRNLAPSVTKQDLENLCKNYDGFKRVALSDPAPERGFFRRGWITFDANTDVKKICWSLQNIKLKECNPGAIVNRELTNRIRPITNLVSHHKSVVKHNIRLAMKIVQNMDKKWNLWQEETNNEENINHENDENKKSNEESSNGQEQQGQTSSTTDENAKLEEEAFSKLKPQASLYLTHKFNGLNPLLENITDYLVDEINAEEEELLGAEPTTESGEITSESKKAKSSKSFDIEFDKSYNKVLDRLVLYLRMVHSIDYYNAIEYQQEDLMPNRCGIMFVRPSLPSNAASASLKTNNDEISQYNQQFESRMKPYIDFKEKVDSETARKLGCKDLRDEIEKFIKSNTQELAQDRWLCPLSGKRFKGPEFIRKHLFYKHMEKITEVKKEVEYFNNYVNDPKRPQLPEHPSNRSNNPQSINASQSNSNQSSSMSSSNQMQSSYPNQNMMMMNQGGMMPPSMMPYGQMGAGNRPGFTWQQGFMPDMNAGYGGYNQGFGGGMGGWNPHAGPGFKKTGFGGGMHPQGAGFRGRGHSREMIQYKDLDAPEDL